MRAVLQRVTQASVSVDGAVVASIGPGLLVLLAVAQGDTRTDADYLSAKIVNLRIFEDGAGRMNRSVLDTGGGILVVSQFTLYGDCRKGRRPSFDEAAPPAGARLLYEYFTGVLRATGLSIATGVFQAEMEVSLVNHGPVTLICESNNQKISLQS